MVYTRPTHSDPFTDGSATDGTIIIDALSDGLEAAEASLLLKSTIASPTFTGTPAAPTAAVATDTTQLATTAFVGLRARVTHPNTDDVLVQVWDIANARWQTAHYDSGWRNLSSYIDSAFNGSLRGRMTGTVVTLSAEPIGRVTVGGSRATPTAIITALPTEWRPYGGYQTLGIAFNTGAGTALMGRIDDGAGTGAYRVTDTGTWASGDNLYFDLTYRCRATTTPASLPGTLVTAAPA